MVAHAMISCQLPSHGCTYAVAHAMISCTMPSHIIARPSLLCVAFGDMNDGNYFPIRCHYWLRISESESCFCLFSSYVQATPREHWVTVLDYVLLSFYIMPLHKKDNLRSCYRVWIQLRTF